MLLIDMCCRQSQQMGPGLPQGLVQSQAPACLGRTRGLLPYKVLLP